MAIINARSPYFVSITDANISYSTLEIYIYSGAKTATVTAEYNLQKSKIGTSTKVSFEISELIRDYLDVTFDGDYDTTATYEGSAKWVKTIIKAFNSAGTQVGSTVTETNIALDGYSYFEEGSSFTMSDKSLFKSDGDIFLPKFGDSNIAIYTENNPTVLLLDSAGATVDTSTFATSVQSDEQIKYVSLYPELITNFGFDNSLNWSIQSSDVIEDGLLKFGGQNGSRFPTDFTQVQNKNYILKFTITDVESGNLSVFSGSSGQSLSGLLNTAGDYVYQYTHNSSAANSFSFSTSDNFIGSIDNTSIKEVYEVARIKVTTNGSEICVNGDFATDTNWVKETSDWTIGNGASFLNSTDLAVDRLYQSATVIGLNLVCEFTVTNFSGTGFASMRYPFVIDITRNGTYRVEGVGIFDRIQFQAQANDLSDPLQFSIDNVSVKEILTKTTENVKQVEECKFKPHKITFINKNGVLDDMYFFKKSSNSMTTKRESYNANTIKADNTYSINEHNKIDFNITANSTVKLSSGFLNESTNEIFKQLLLSERVWITRTFENSELVLPINIKTSSISYKTSLNDRLVEYSIDFDDSYESINNIR
jgi:hypothetical protein